MFIERNQEFEREEHMVAEQVHVLLQYTMLQVEGGLKAGTRKRHCRISNERNNEIEIAQ